MLTQAQFGLSSLQSPGLERKTMVIHRQYLPPAQVSKHADIFAPKQQSKKSPKFGDNKKAQMPSQTASQAHTKASVQNPFSVQAAAPVAEEHFPPKPPNELKQLFQSNQAVVYALNIRTFGAHDDNADGRINPELGESGTFRSAIPKLDELSQLGVNCIHLLPINPIGEKQRLGEGGSLYAPSDFHSINPEFGTLDDARAFIQAAHQKGLKVMVDVPSCASIDLGDKYPNLIKRDEDGNPRVPTTWKDIEMMGNGPEVQAYYEPFFDLMANKVGVDGFRCDVARARDQAFWKHFTAKYSDKAWLAESYCEEDQSPLQNIPRDTPEKFLTHGFDSIYGQFHIFPGMTNANEYRDYLLSSHAMFQRAGVLRDNPPKSFIGSFLTHDDPSLMGKGGALMCILSSGLMTTQPYTNPYILDGFTTGFKGDFDIFRFSPKPEGHDPEIGRFMKQMLSLRKTYEPIFSQGTYIPIPTKGGPNNQIIAFARQAPMDDTDKKAQSSKTLLVVANKDINSDESATLSIPGLKENQPLKNLAPDYGGVSWMKPSANRLDVKLSPGRFYVFEINTPDLGKKLPTYSGV
jgi:glycosidase